MNYKNVIKLLKRQRNSGTSEELGEAVEYAAYSFLVKTCKVLKRERRELSGVDMVNAFVAGTEWQKEQKPAEWSEEEKPSDDLEAAAEMAARKIYPYEVGMKGLICENSIPIYKAGFIAGTEWQRGQDAARRK